MTTLMGMFDKPQYLTGTGADGYVKPGETFYLHAARMDGVVNVNGKERDQAKLLVSHEADGEKTVVFTSGAGIVGQIRRMDQNDRANFPMELRLDQVPSKQGNPTNVLTPASEAAPEVVAEMDEASF